MKAPARRERKAGAADARKQLALLPEPPFSPTWPHTATLAHRSLELFLRGHSLTHPQFEAITFSWRLAAVVNELRELGWPIVSTDISAPTPECPDRVIARYGLTSEVIAQAMLLRRSRGA